MKTKAIFLSASVPVPGRGHFYKTTDVMLIHAAIQGLISAVLGRRLLVWGGHPAITPMIWASAEAMGIPYAKAVHLYQSLFFEDYFPEENKRFKNVTYVQKVAEDREASLKEMRIEMLRGHKYSAAVFIGGMEGALDEYSLFCQHHNNLPIIAVASTGGAALDIFNEQRLALRELSDSVDYVGIFYRTLNISPKEKRIKRPK